MKSRVIHSLIAAAVFLLSAQGLGGCRNHYRRQEDQRVPVTIDREKVEEANRRVIARIREDISGFARKNGWNLKETGTGVWYQVLQRLQPDASTVKSGAELTLDYTLSTLGGPVCYSSDSLGPKRFIVDKSQAETGLHEAVKFLKPGDSARIVIPPQRGYGLAGDGNRIPPGAILVYQVRITETQFYQGN